MPAQALELRTPNRRPLFFVLIVSAHALFAWAFINISIQRDPVPAVPVIEVDMTPVARTVEPPPPPPDDVQLADSNAALPDSAPPPINFPLEAPVVNPVVAVIPPLGGPTPQLVQPLPTGASFDGAPPDPDRYYPAESIRRHEQGAVMVRMCVNADGRFDGPPRVMSSSGYALLDAAAIQWGQDVKRMRPATVNGQPIHSCKSSRVVFHLR